MTTHILFIIDGLPGGGAENVTLTLAGGMADRGHAVTLLSLNNRLDYDIPANVDYRVDHDNGHGPLRKLTELSRRARSLDHQLEQLFIDKGRPALVISSLHKTDRIVVKSKQLSRCNVWHCVHGIYSRSYLGNKKPLARYLKRAKIQQVYRGRKIITVSDAVGEDLVKVMGIVPRELITIYNPFDVEQIQQRAMEENPFAGEDYILHVGRFHQVKRQDRLLEAFAQADLPAKLVIIGQGEETATARLKAKIIELNLQQKVILAGFSKNPLPMIKGARLFALSSDSEGLPTVLIESLICGTPIVSTACPGGVGEIMVGELAPYQAELDAASLAEKLRLGWQSPPIITAAMYARFDINLIIDRYLKLAVE
ncbi:glycosyltransferase [Erwiniaceae bacterium BAC15a-03b]|uniref:Glycosyltransferase n=1 Tax=Winslowiella arboricola TaxID=2978220 RepID=A0A9J6PGR6_9GAMM|nr:glycosyltransferase [Winslowiella arboricola]MCU5773534.1 glycosyltransferase [Winslowiella arboricola]MCU5776554.1 glycosyltransferase [Winslowiella arboricola]